MNEIVNGGDWKNVHPPKRHNTSYDILLKMIKQSVPKKIKLWCLVLDERINWKSRHKALSPILHSRRSMCEVLVPLEKQSKVKMWSFVPLMNWLRCKVSSPLCLWRQKYEVSSPLDEPTKTKETGSAPWWSWP